MNVKLRPLEHLYSCPDGGLVSKPAGSAASESAAAHGVIHLHTVLRGSLGCPFWLNYTFLLLKGNFY